MNPAEKKPMGGNLPRGIVSGPNKTTAKQRVPSKSLSVPLPAPSNSPPSSSEGEDDDDDELTQTVVNRRRLRSVSSANLVNAEALLLPPRQARVILWAVPRSISTAFFRAIMEGARIKVLLEPFSNAYYFGDERISQRYLDRPATPGARFSDITKLYEQPYTRYKAVFVKDMAYYLTNKRQAQTFSQLLPRGYVHTFLIRHPARSVASLYKLSIDKARTGWDWFNAAEAGFKELYQLFMFVTQCLGQQAIVVDANDLMKNPRKTLIRYCSTTGLEFSEKMLSWKSIDYSLTEPEDMNDKPVQLSGVYHDEGEQHTDESKPVGIEAAAEKQLSIPPEIFRGWQPWFEGVLSSSTFCEFSLPPPLPPSTPKMKRAPTPPPNIAATSSSTKKQDSSTPATAIGEDFKSALSLPAKVNECIAECMPYYDYLKKFKI